MLHVADLHFRPLTRPGKSKWRPFPEWAQYTPDSIWIYDTTHFTRAGMAVLIIEDLVSGKWLTATLEAEGLLEAVEACHDDGRVDLTTDNQTRLILLAVSDNGPQMTSGSTRDFMALCAIAQHFGRPGTPTDQDRARRRPHNYNHPAARRHSATSHPTTSTRDVEPNAIPSSPWMISCNSSNDRRSR